MGDAGDLDAQHFDGPSNVHAGGFSVDGGVGGDDDFCRFTVPQSADEFLDFEHFWGHIVHGGQGAVDDMVDTVVFSDSFHGGHVSGVLYDTDGAMVPGWVATDGARAAVRNVPAGLTVGEVFLGF